MTIILFFLLIVFSSGIIFLLYSANYPKAQRYQQDVVAIVAPFFALCCFLLVQLGLFFPLENWIESQLMANGFLYSSNLSIGAYVLYLAVALLFYPLKKVLMMSRTKGLLKQTNISQYFYTKDNTAKAFFLKSEFYYPLRYMTTSIQAFMGLLLLSLMVAYLDRPIPSYVFLILFFLLEIYWFMNGSVQQSTKTSPTTPTTTGTPIVAKYHDLWETYQQIWKDNLIQAFMLHPTAQSMEESHLIEKESLIVNYKQHQIFDTIYEKITDTVNKGKTVILFIPDHFQPMIPIQQSEQYHIIQKMLFKGRVIGQFCTTNIDDLKKDKRIFINSIDNFLEQKLNIEKDKSLLNWFEDLSMVLYFGYDKSLIESPESTVSVSSILKYLCLQPENLTTIVFAEERRNAQSAFTSNIRVNARFEEIRLQDQQPKLSLFLNWKKEAAYETGLVGPLDYQMGPIASLLPLPYTKEIYQVEAQATTRAYLENFENLKKYKDAWLSRYAPLKQLNNQRINQYAQYRNHQLSFEYAAEKVIFLDNQLNNSPLLFKYFNGFATNISLVQIFTAPHILRKYFNDNFEFFAASPVLPLSYLLLKEDRTTLALSLLEKLSKCKLSFDELYNDFNETNTPSKIVLAQIKDLFIDVFNFDVISSDFLEISKDAKGQFLFSLKPDIKDHIELFKTVKFLDENNEAVFRKNKHLLFQKYAQGQFHAFNGRMYEISRIFKEGDDIKIKINNQEPDKNYFSYTEKRVVTGKPLNIADCMHSNTVNQNEYAIHIYRNHFEVHTNGYFEFDVCGFSLKEGDFTFHRREEVKTRTYKNGRVLCLALKKVKDIPITGLLTLRIILEEISKILFPDSYQFLIFRAFSPALQDKTTPTPNKDIADYYQLNNAPYPEEEQTGIYIYEDSIFDLGHLRSIKDNMDYILQLMDDYLDYSASSLNAAPPPAKHLAKHFLYEEVPFLAFGLKAVTDLGDFPQPIDVEGAKLMLERTLRGRNGLGGNRVGFYTTP